MDEDFQNMQNCKFVVENQGFESTRFKQFFKKEWGFERKTNYCMMGLVG
jgi:hypothetical protein